ncbi:phosphotransferase family protein [Paenibacillus flagellatus]|uniref:Aminoglycoside phosphotransferase family protein n=1 Tax=Paenibacillus flagellatus TaxID=2211139 RepID=A0A2V5KCI5_9BACL|nr:aminoglycoside phosphotransferase family protein [Paenibacillus flagellatus]PYI55663.1 aminoglycoside phosphotransferase family protein [Paenibacillus flagellatus]
MKEQMERIRLTYPDFTFGEAVRIETGQNNDVWVVDRKWVFRFPKYASGAAVLRDEVVLLQTIRDRVSLPVPEPAYYSFAESAGQSFMGYALLPGTPLWKDELSRIRDRDALLGLASQLAEFLAGLHAIPADSIPYARRNEAKTPHEEMEALYADIRDKLFPHMRPDARENVSRAFETYVRGTRLPAAAHTIIHGDFGSSNLLWDAGERRITGVIDFGGSGPGDPAYDLAGLRASYGEPFYGLVAGLYPNGAELLERVTFYQSTFALQEALHGIVHGDEKAFEAGIASYR